VAKFSRNFEEIVLCVHGNSDEEDKVLGVSHKYY
jgi:hypothetical protein